MGPVLLYRKPRIIEEQLLHAMQNQTMSTQKKHIHYIPAELIEQILLNLPIKSLFRFSTVSKSWNLMISQREFVKSYIGRESIVLGAYSDKALVIPLSSISSDNPIDKAKPFTRPFKADTYVNASCGELWCVEFQNSLLLHNPSMQAYRKLPIPSAPVPIGSTIEATSVSVFVYGLGYDSAANDYKIVKIHRDNYVISELYSLTSDCWRKIRSPPQNPYKITFSSSKGVFVSGAIHWLVSFRHNNNGVSGRSILSFDLSQEKYGLLNMPQPPQPIFMNERRSRSLDMIVFGGKLRLCLNYGWHTRFVVWVMEDYESKSWTKELEINYAHIYPLCYANLKPFYFYDSGGNVIKAVTSSTNMQKIYLYKEEEDGSSTLVEKNFGSNICGMFSTYVESFASVWPGGSYDGVVRMVE